MEHNVHRRGAKPHLHATPPLVPINSLAFRERRVIVMLRAFQAPAGHAGDGERRVFANLRPSIRDAFGELARQAKINDLVIFKPGSPFVSIDEITIVHRLSMLQRPSQSSHWKMVNDFQHSLKRCADELSDDPRRLPARPLPAHANCSQADCFSIEFEDDAPAAEVRGQGRQPNRSPQLWDGKREPEAGSLQAIAVQIVRSQPLTRAAQFLGVGITHQYLSTLHKQGYVERAGHGVYRYPQRLRDKEAPAPK